MRLSPCDLCHAQASVFCPSDSAFLCWPCDAHVHQANFLAARHLRQYLCSNCCRLTGRAFSGGVGFQPSCPPPSADDDLDSLSSSNSSVCVSTSTATAKDGGRRVGLKRVDNFKAEGIFVNWCSKLGVGAVDLTVRMACRALRVCRERWTVLPYRVCLAASMWLGLRLGREKRWQVLKRLEEISGVPAKIILAAESKLERALRQQQRRRLELQEGWAEC